jgi:hypothetical protein
MTKTEQVLAMVDQTISNQLRAHENEVNEYFKCKSAKQSFLDFGVCVPSVWQMGKGPLCLNHLPLIENEDMNYYLTQIPLLSNGQQSVSPGIVRIAYLIVVSSDTKLALSLLSALYEQHYTFVIHLDSSIHQDSITEFENALMELFPSALLGSIPNIHILKKHFSLSGAGIEIVFAQIASIIQLFLTNRSWDYVINLSENDWPIKTNQQIEDTLLKESANKTINFIEHNLVDKASSRYDNIQNYQYFPSCDPSLPPIKIKSETIHSMFPSSKRQTSGFETYFHSAFGFALTKDFCKFLITEVHLEDYLSTYHNSLSPQEWFISTVLMSSPFANTVDPLNRNWHYEARGKVVLI